MNGNDDVSEQHSFPHIILSIGAEARNSSSHPQTVWIHVPQ